MRQKMLIQESRRKQIIVVNLRNADRHLSSLQLMEWMIPRKALVTILLLCHHHRWVIFSHTKQNLHLASTVTLFTKMNETNTQKYALFGSIKIIHFHLVHALHFCSSFASLKLARRFFVDDSDKIYQSVPTWWLHKFQFHRLVVDLLCAFFLLFPHSFINRTVFDFFSHFIIYCALFSFCFHNEPKKEKNLHLCTQKHVSFSFCFEVVSFFSSNVYRTFRATARYYICTARVAFTHMNFVQIYRLFSIWVSEGKQCCLFGHTGEANRKLSCEIPFKSYRYAYHAICCLQVTAYQNWN